MTQYYQNNSSLNKTSQHKSEEDINAFLNEEKNALKLVSWNKLNKNTKLELLLKWANKHSKQEKFNKEKTKKLKQFIKDTLEKKQLQRVKDVCYNKETNEITSIPNLIYNNDEFYLKNIDKRVTTSKCLGPLKKNKTLKKKKDITSVAINETNKETSHQQDTNTKEESNNSSFMDFFKFNI